MSSNVFSDTVASGTTRNVLVPKGDSVVGIQIDSTGGAGTVEVKTRLVGAAAFNSQTSVSSATVILNMVNIEELELSATNGSQYVTVTTVDK